MRNCRKVLTLLATTVLLPAVVYAQASVTGVVKDASGAVLPGVTVEAASPALIEKVRTAITDGVGQYRVIDLLPGSYVLTFTLTGFSTVKREGIEITGAGIFTVNVDMRVGVVTETVTVSGAAPVVDVQSVRREVVMNEQVLSSVPAIRGYSALLNAVPAMQGGNLNSSIANTTSGIIGGVGGGFFNTYGSRPNEGRVNLDGLNIGGAYNGGGQGFSPDPSVAEEMQVTLAGGLGESEVGSAMVNFVPKSGGNTFKGHGFGSGAGAWSQGSNLDAQLESYGITNPAALIKQWDASGSLGGPIKSDKLWFFMNARNVGAYTVVPGIYGNENAGNPAAWNYVANPNLQARSDVSTQDYMVRLTAQITPRNKVNATLDQQFQCTGSSYLQNGSCRPAGSNWVAEGSATASPEATTFFNNNFPARVAQATWSSPVTSRLLLEAGFSTYHARWGWSAPPGALTNFTPVTELASNAATGVPSAGFTYRGNDNILDNNQTQTSWHATASYVTGSHNMKFGYQASLAQDYEENFANSTQLTYTFLNGSPTSFTMRIAPWQVDNNTEWYAAFAQDQWTINRVTIQGAVRYDHAWSWFPGSGNGAPVPSRFNATPIVFPTTQGVTGFNDITPRMGVAWDVFGNGKTAVKVALGKYLEDATNQNEFVINNPALDGTGIRAQVGTHFYTTTSRSWNDVTGTYNPVTDGCNLLNPAAQTNAAGVVVCGADTVPNFGNASQVLQVDPNTQHGWGVRPSDWHLGASVQQQIAPGVSVEGGYNRRWFNGFFITENRNVSASDYSPYTVTAPLNPGLPGGGGYTFTALNLNPNKFIQPAQNYFTSADNFGGETAYWQGFEATITARRGNLVLSGGTSTGRGHTDNCALVAAIPGLLGTNQRAGVGGCDVVEPWLTDIRSSAIYTVPKVDVLVGAIFRVQHTTMLTIGNNMGGTNGPSLSAIYTEPNTLVAQSLGRLPSGGLANGTTSVNLLIPNTMYQPPIHTVDMRFAKVLRLPHVKTTVGIDLFNLLNANTGTALTTNFGVTGTTWNRPTAILLPRFAQFNVTLDY